MLNLIMAPEGQWAAILLLCLSGPEHQAINTLLGDDLASYKKVRAAIL